jgi:hypothetical protein
MPSLGPTTGVTVGNRRESELNDSSWPMNRCAGGAFPVIPFSGKREMFLGDGVFLTVKGKTSDFLALPFKRPKNAFTGDVFGPLSWL